MCKHILVISESINNVKGLTELYRLFLYVNIQMFKFFQWFPFINKEMFFYKAILEENLKWADG